METLAERLVFARDAKGWKNAELQRRAGLKSPSTITEIIKHARTKSPQLPQIAEALGVEVKWLQTGKGPMRRAEAAAPEGRDAKVEDFKRRKEDARPLLREIIDLCMGMNDEGLKAVKAACTGLAPTFPLASAESPLKQTA